MDFVIVRFLMKLFNTTKMDIINNCRQYFGVKLPSTLWSDRVKRFEKKFAECDNFFAKFLSQFDSLYLSLSKVSIMFFCFSHVYLLPVMVNKDVYIMIYSS